MPIQKKIFLGLFGTFTLFMIGLYVYAWTLPSTWKVERSIVIDAPAEAVWARVHDLNVWDAWVPWTKERDPTMKTQFTGEPGDGQQWVFMGNLMGQGRILVNGYEANASLRYDLEFVRAEISKGEIKLVSLGDSGTPRTRVTWIDRGSKRGVLDRFTVDHIKAGVGYDFEIGLAKLKKLCESNEEKETTDEHG